MKRLLCCCFIVCHLIGAHAQNWTWAEHAGGVLPDEANGCTMDNNGNMFASGFYFSSSINFGNGNSLSNDGLSDGFIVKYNATGSTQWSSKMKGPKEDKATGCAVDNAGNVIVTGYFDSPSLQFGGNNSHNISNFDNSGNTFDAFIVKYNASGTPQWFHAIGKSDDDGGRSVTSDSAGNVYLTGWYRAPSIVVGSVTLYNNNLSGGSSDMLLIKYDPNGNVLWAKSAGGIDDEKGNRVVVDGSGNVIVTGYCKADSIAVDGNYYRLNGSKDAFVIKYSPTGTLLAARIFGGSGGEEPFSCSVDASGNVFLTGSFSSNTLPFDAHTLTNTGSGFGVFLAKLDPALTALWAFSAGSNDDDEARGCSTDKYGNTVITGVFTGSGITFGNTVLNNNGGEEIFLAKFDPDGNLFWAEKAGKSKDDGSNDCFIDNDGRVLIAGYYNSSSIRFGNIDYDNSYVIIPTSDYFIAQTCQTLKGSDVQSACGEYTWIDGNTYRTTGNTAIFNYPGGASNACDSMVTLDLTITAPDVSLTTTISGITANAANATYRWLDCDDNFAFLQGETAQTFTATANGNYAVEVTQNACTDTSACVIISTVGISVKEILSHTTVYPNPNNGLVQLDFGSLKNVSVRLLNLKGQSVYQKADVSKGTLQFELKEPAGIYIVEVIAENVVERYKLILN